MNEQVKNNIMEYKQKYLQKLADAQVPEKLEKQLEEMDWTCLELIHQKKQQRGTFAPLNSKMAPSAKSAALTMAVILPICPCSSTSTPARKSARPKIIGLFATRRLRNSVLSSAERSLVNHKFSFSRSWPRNANQAMKSQRPNALENTATTAPCWRTA